MTAVSPPPSESRWLIVNGLNNFVRHIALNPFVHSRLQVQLPFTLAVGYVHPLNSVIDLKPSVLARYTSNTPITADINVSAFFYKKFWTGVMYRMNESVGVNLGIQLVPSLMLGYSYDFPVNQLIMNQWGSHEFALIFDFKNSKSTFISPRYF
jgi:type IX secretion system PorP/SprF family membrane protein